MNDLIFASTSPRRKELLLQISERFKFRSPAFQEKKISDLSSLEISKFNSLSKAMSISKTLRNDFIFGADTVISINNETIEKPIDDDDAMKILLKLRNSFHEVITNISVVKNEKLIFSEKKISLVKTTNISTDKIKEYIDTGYYKDKAGGYGIQNKKFDFIKYFYGCYENILGLPTCLIKKFLIELGFINKITFSECLKV